MTYMYDDKNDYICWNTPQLELTRDELNIGTTFIGIIYLSLLTVKRHQIRFVATPTSVVREPWNAYSSNSARNIDVEDQQMVKVNVDWVCEFSGHYRQDLSVKIHQVVQSHQCNHDHLGVNLNEVSVLFSQELYSHTIHV